MSETTTDPAAAARAQHEALWQQLRADVAAVTEAHPGPDAVTRMLWEAMTLAFEAGAMRAGAAAMVGARMPRMSDAGIIDRVLSYAKTADTDPRVAALHELTQARIAAAAPVDDTTTGGGNCDG